MSDIAITVRDLGKRYRLGGGGAGYRTLRDSLVGAADRIVRRQPREDLGSIWALRHVSFDVARGQVLGIIGRNGAGKSTLLKILSRVTEPTEGEAEIHGRVGSLLEVGTGFHPELSGRENIFLNAAILGMGRVEIQRKFDEIVSFAEVERFLDTPVKHYSSGMYLRLAFAVAAHLDPEILVVDEVLAVGDAEFQRKCLGKMSSVAQEGRTVLFVSHNMSAVLRLTDETIVIESGQIALRAPSATAVDYYLAAGMGEAGERRWDGDARAAAAAPFRPIALRVLDSQGRIVSQVSSTAAFEIEFEYELDQDVAGLRTGVYLSTSRGEPVWTSFDADDPATFDRLRSRRRGRYRSRCHVPPNMLNEGMFALGVNASAFRVRSFFTDERALTFSVDGAGSPGSHWPEPRPGPVRPALIWDISEVSG
ncbi:MAG TPA: polysaccharide ABC transporter ATP-binding protein [Anaerolineales bacterium]|nr:polysaccharide ABC transporter ATP-binding protein [Anaerolineales bacterium]